jgi:hypothetical protein
MGRRNAWNWQASARIGARVLTDIRPWLRLKAPEPDIALTYWNGRASAVRDGNGRFLAMCEEDRRNAEAAEAAVKAAKRLDESRPDKGTPTSRIPLATYEAPPPLR